MDKFESVLSTEDSIAFEDILNNMSLLLLKLRLCDCFYGGGLESFARVERYGDDFVFLLSEVLNGLEMNYLALDAFSCALSERRRLLSRG